MMTSIKNITEIKDKAVRHNLIQRYLEVETSLEEEHLLIDFYRHAKDDELTKEDRTIRTILLGTTGKEDLTLSDSAVTKFDRIIAGTHTQRMSDKQVKQPQHTTKSIRISAILLAAAMLIGLIFLILPSKQQRNAHLLSQPASQTICQNTETGLTNQEAWAKEDSIFLANEQSQTKPRDANIKRTTSSPQYKKEEIVLTKKAAKKIEEETVKEPTSQQEASEPNVLEILDKCNEIAYLLHPTTELIGMEYDGNNSILTITDEKGATYQYKIQTEKGNGEDYQLSPLASITPDDYTHY